MATSTPNGCSPICGARDGDAFELEPGDVEEGGHEAAQPSKKPLATQLRFARQCRQARARALTVREVGLLHRARGSASRASPRSSSMTEIVGVFGREILDSRGNPTVEVEVAARGWRRRSRRRALGRVHRRVRGLRAARRRQEALPRQGRAQGRRQRQQGDRAGAARPRCHRSGR